MKVTQNVFKLMLALVVFSVAQLGFAASRTLIDLDASGKPVANLAKSWTKVKDGEYKFDLDPAAEIADGVKVSPAAVKSSLEGKLAGEYGVAVKPSGATGVDITYTCDEAQFLSQLSKAKIRSSGGDVKIALDSSVSEGGIRAKVADRAAAPGEVKATVLRLDGKKIIGSVGQSQYAKIKAGDKVTVLADGKGLKKGDLFFFKPAAQKGGAWTPAPGSFLK